MPNDYFVPGYDNTNDYFGQRKRQFVPPPLRTPDPQMRQMPQMVGDPDLVGGLGGPAVPPVMQVEQPAPPPLKPLSRSDRYAQAVPETKPVTGAARYINALQRGGIVGVVAAALDRKAPEREQAELSRRRFMDQIGLEHQDKQDELSEIQKRAYESNINSQIADRAEHQRDKDEDRERQYIAAGWMPATPGELQEMPEDGKPARYEYANVGGQQRKRLTEYAKTADTQAAKQSDWVDATPDLARAFPEFIKPGQKLSPQQFEHYSRQLESRRTAEENRKSREDLAREALETRRELAAGLAATRAAKGEIDPDVVDKWANGIKAGKFKIEQVPKEYKNAVALNLGDNAPAPLTEHAQKIVSEVEPVLQQIRRLKAALEPMKDNNTPGYFLPDRLKYMAGYDSGLGGEIADLSMAGILGAARILHGTSRAKTIFNKATEHTPNAWIDSPKMMYGKLDKMEQNIADGKNATIEEGNKYGVRGAISGGGTPASTVMMYNPKTGKSGPVAADKVAAAKAAGLTETK